MDRTVGWLSCLALLALGASAADQPVQEVSPPKHWDRFLILVWQYKHNVAAEKAGYESVNIGGFHIDRKNDALQAFARQSHWPYYVDHAAGKGYLHLLDKVKKEISRKKEIIQRPNSLADAATMEAMKNLLKENITAAKDSSVVAYAFDDEISPGVFGSPVETDGSPNSVAGYRKFLEKMYGTIERLNAQYGSTHKSFSELQPQSFEAFRKQLTPKGLGSVNFSKWCDWRSYMDTQFSNTLAELTRYANSLDPNTPAGFVGGHNPGAFSGCDYAKISQAVQWIEAYDIGGSNEILRSFWSQKRPRMQTYFSSGNAQQDAWFLWYYLCHGTRGVIVWPEYNKQELWFSEGKVAPVIKANAATFKEVQGPLSKLIIDSEFSHDPVAIYYSHPSIQMTWALDAACHGGTWPNRSSSLDNATNTASLSRIAWLKTLEDLGVQAKFVHREQLLGGQLEKGKFKVLLLNRALCLSEAEAAAIKAFVAKGGAVVADHLCGIFDEHGKAYPKSPIDELFGIRRDLSQGLLGGQTLTEVDGELEQKFALANWAVQGAALFAEMPVIERGLCAEGTAKADKSTDGGAAVVRKGKAVYLNLSPCGYLLKRPKQEAKQWLPWVADLLKELGVSPRLTLQENGQPAQQLEPIFWSNGERTVLCLIKNIDRRAEITGFGQTGGGLESTKTKLKLSFAAPVKELKNERSGRVLGSGRQFEDEFSPWEANVYTYRP